MGAGQTGSMVTFLQSVIGTDGTVDEAMKDGIRRRTWKDRTGDWDRDRRDWDRDRKAQQVESGQTGPEVRLNRLQKNRQNRGRRDRRRERGMGLGQTGPGWEQDS